LLETHNEIDSIDRIQVKFREEIRLGLEPSCIAFELFNE